MTSRSCRPPAPAAHSSVATAVALARRLSARPCSVVRHQPVADQPHRLEAGAARTAGRSAGAAAARRPRRCWGPPRTRSPRRGRGSSPWRPPRRQRRIRNSSIENCRGVSSTSVSPRVTRCRAGSRRRSPTSRTVGRSPAPAADQRPQPGDQHDERERLGQEVVCSRVERLCFLLRPGPRGQHQDRRPVTGLAAPRAELVTTKLRQHDVEHQRVVAVLPSPATRPRRRPARCRRRTPPPRGRAAAPPRAACRPRRPGPA